VSLAPSAKPKAIIIRSSVAVVKNVGKSNDGRWEGMKYKKCNNCKHWSVLIQKSEEGFDIRQECLSEYETCGGCSFSPVIPASEPPRDKSKPSAAGHPTTTGGRKV